MLHIFTMVVCLERNCKHLFLLLLLLLLQIYPSSQKPSLKKMTTAMQRGMALSALVYVAVGACGYSAFGSRWGQSMEGGAKCVCFIMRSFIVVTVSVALD